MASRLPFWRRILCWALSAGQWVLSLPHQLRYLLAWDHGLCRAVRAVYVRALLGAYRKAFRRVTGPDVLILDDAGFADLHRDAADELFRVVCARHKERSTVVVSNLPFKQWAEFLPSPAQAVAIADRLVDDATIQRFTGKPYRQPREPMARRSMASSAASSLAASRPSERDHRPAASSRGGAGRPVECRLSTPGSTCPSFENPDVSRHLMSREVDSSFPYRS